MENFDRIQYVENRTKNRVVAFVSSKGDILNAPFNLLKGSFDYFEIDNISCINDIISSIDEHSDLCEGKGIVEYKREIISFLIDSFDIDYHSFLLPLKCKNGRVALIMEVYHDNVHNEVDFFFQRIDKGGALEDISSAISSNYKDNLTGLFNLNTCYQHLRTNRRNVHFVLFDLNKFKMLNDSYGHYFGDIFLQDISNFLISISTCNEIFYRRSGDEFMILIFKDEYEYAYNIIMEINDHLKKLSEEKYGKYDNVDISAAFGLIYLPFSSKPEFFENQFLDIVKLADVAMYKAKSSKETLVYMKPEEYLPLLKDENRLNEMIKEYSRANRNR